MRNRGRPETWRQAGLGGLQLAEDDLAEGLAEAVRPGRAGGRVRCTLTARPPFTRSMRNRARGSVDRALTPANSHFTPASRQASRNVTSASA